MTPAFRVIAPGVWVWSEYSPEVKVELSSTALEIDGDWWFIDPIPLPAAAPAISPKGVILTNTNHERDAVRWQSSAILYAPTGVLESVPHRSLAELPLPFELFPLPGGAPGETALFVSLPTKRLCIVGDALVNLPPKFPLMALPEKYCDDPQQLLESLQSLASQQFDLLCFAHGEPITEHPREQLSQLLR